MHLLRAFREKNRIRQIELAKKSGISQSFLSATEAGYYFPNNKFLEKIKRGYSKLGVYDFERVIQALSQNNNK